MKWIKYTILLIMAIIASCLTLVILTSDTPSLRICNYIDTTP